MIDIVSCTVQLGTMISLDFLSHVYDQRHPFFFFCLLSGSLSHFLFFSFVLGQADTFQSLSFSFSPPNQAGPSTRQGTEYSPCHVCVDNVPNRLEKGKRERLGSWQKGQGFNTRMSFASIQPVFPSEATESIQVDCMLKKKERGRDCFACSHNEPGSDCTKDYNYQRCVQENGFFGWWTVPGGVALSPTTARNWVPWSLASGLTKGYRKEWMLSHVQNTGCNKKRSRTWL